MAFLDVEAKELKKLEAKLDNFLEKIRRPEQANREASIQLYQFVIKNIDTGGRLVGGWAPLAPATIREKQRIGKEKPLIRTGQLRNSFVPFSSVDNGGVKSDLDYAADHEEGRPERNLPQRKLLPTQTQASKIGVKVYRDFIRREAMRNFR
jgi:hypothetical protein